MEILTETWHDLIHAGRSLARARAFTAVCVLSLGIGMTPVIGVPYGIRIFTTPPPGVPTDGLVELVTAQAGPRNAGHLWSWPDYVDLRDAGTGLSIAGWTMGSSSVALASSGGDRTPAQTLFVSPNYFDVMQVRLARGPGFGGTTGPAVIVAYRFWQRHLGADPDIVGKTIALGDVPHVVVGIAPDGFGGHLVFHDAQLFVPLERHPRLLADDTVRFDRSAEWMRIHGRLLPGVSLSQANAAVSAITSQLARTYPATNELRSGVAAPYHAVGHLQSADVAIVTKVAQAAVWLPLLVVCLNVAGMVQVRNATRERELSIRQAIGASRPRLMRYLLAEAVLLAALGGGLAALVIFNLPSLISWLAGEPIPAAWREALRVDASILALCVGYCLATSLLFGWLPALRFSRPAILAVLKDDAGAGRIRVGRVHRAATVLQVAVAVPLLVLSAVSLDRVRATATQHLGFAADLLYAAPLRLDADAGTDLGFQIRRVRDALAGMDGVAAVTVADGLPLDFRYRIARVALETGSDAAPAFVPVHVTRVGEEYLTSMDIPLLVGRRFTRDDGPGTELVTVISRALAEALFPGHGPSDALGRRLTFQRSLDPDVPPRTLTVVGVTEDFPTSQMSTERPQLLLPLSQHAGVVSDSVPVNDDHGGGPEVMIVARSAPGESPLKMTAALERAMREVDPEFQAASVVTGAWLREKSMNDFMTQSSVSATAGGVILILAALGIHGVIGLMVSTRTREIAVRMALGASRRRVTGMILFDVIRLIAPGVIIGLLIAAVLVRVNGGILGVPLSGLEPLAYVVGAAIVVLIAVAATLAPARRAASVQPMAAMRVE